MRLKNLPKRLDLDLCNRDDFAMTFTFFYGDEQEFISPPENKTPIDVSSWEFLATWRPFEDSPQSVTWFIDKSDAFHGNVVVNIYSTMVEAMREISVSGVWDLEVTYEADKIKTFAKGYVYLVRDVTYAEIQ